MRALTIIGCSGPMQTHCGRLHRDDATCNSIIDDINTFHGLSL